MSDLPTRNTVDPKRFTGKKFTRRKSFPNSVNDYSAVIDRCEAGRILKEQRSGNRVVWFWTLTGPYFPGPKSHDGEEETLEAAQKAFKVKFWQWHECPEAGRPDHLAWSKRMSAKGVDFLELWIERNVLPTSADRTQAARLAQKLETDAAAEGLTVADLEIQPGEVETYIRDIIVHVGEPGTPGD